MDGLSTIPPSPSTPRQHSPPMSPVVCFLFSFTLYFLTCIRQPLTPPQPSTPRMNKQQAEAVNSLTLLSPSISNMDLSPVAVEEVLRRDLDTALTMVGKLGEDKWKLEEKTRFLQENLVLLNEDLLRKTRVIQYYVSKTKQV